MTIELNGEQVELDSAATVQAAVERIGAPADRGGIAVAVDGEVVPKSKWGLTPLRNGQRVEVVGAMQGG
jgi:sulfur carrier protein